MSEVRWQRANTWRFKQRQRNINFQVERMCLKAPGRWLQGTCKRLHAEVLDLWECSLSSSTSHLRGRILVNVLVSTSYTLPRNPRGAAFSCHSATVPSHLWRGLLCNAQEKAKLSLLNRHASHMNARHGQKRFHLEHSCTSTSFGGWFRLKANLRCKGRKSFWNSCAGSRLKS